MDVLTYYIDDTSPPIVRTLSIQDAGEFDLQSGASFSLKVRERYSSAIYLDRPMVADFASDTLTYQPVAGDFDTEGVYRSWITVDFGGGLTQDTDEFSLVVLAHSPGEGTRVGAVWRAARALEPVSWDSLRAYPDYGDVELQRVIELAKLRVLSTVVPVGDEASLDPRVVDFVAKKVLAENVLYAAISFWSDQVVQQSARGNSEEVKTYPDRIKAAADAIDRYRDDLERQAGEVGEVLGSVSGAYDAPALDSIGPLLTPGLDEYAPMPVRTPYYWQAPRR